MEYLVLFPPKDEKINLHMNQWLREAGGTMTWVEVQKLLTERFKFVANLFVTPEQLKQMGLTVSAGSNVYKLEDGKISL